MDSKENIIELEFVKSVHGYLNMLNKVHDTPAREKILYYMFKFICEKKSMIDFDNCTNLKNAIHEKLSELFFNYNLSWANELHYDILGIYIENHFPIISDELYTNNINLFPELDVFPVDKNYTLYDSFFNKAEDDKYMNNMIREYFSE
jgi:hypothetical protein